MADRTSLSSPQPLPVQLAGGAEHFDVDLRKLQLKPHQGEHGKVLSGAADMDLLVEDQPTAVGATPSAAATTGAGTICLMSTVVFKGA